jgi:hypothetical protein
MSFTSFFSSPSIAGLKVVEKKMADVELQGRNFSVGKRGREPSLCISCLKLVGSGQVTVELSTDDGVWSVWAERCALPLVIIIFGLNLAVVWVKISFHVFLQQNVGDREIFGTMKNTSPNRKLFSNSRIQKMYVKNGNGIEIWSCQS